MTGEGMELLRVLTALLIPLLSGAAFIAWLLRDEGAGPVEIFSLGCGAGLGALTIEMFVLGLLGVPFGRFVITAPIAACGVLFFFLWKRARPSSVPGSRASSGMKGAKSYIFVFLLAWIALRAGFAGYECLTRPIFSWDAWANWSAGAKVFFYNKGLLLDGPSGEYFGRGYRAFLGHPLHSPLLQVWVSLWTGGFHEVYAKAWTFAYYLSLLGVFFSAVRRGSDTFYAVAALFFLSSSPLLTYHGQDAYSDLPLGYFALASTVCLWRFLNKGGRRFLVLSGLFIGMGIFVKNEGVLFLAGSALALLVSRLFERKDALKDLLCFAAPVILAAGPWVVFKYVNGFGFDHAESHLVPGLHWDVLRATVTELFFNANFNLILPFWLALSVIGYRAVLRSAIGYLYIVIVFVMAAYVLIYFSIETAAVIDASGIHRNTLTYAPMMFFASALLLRRVWPAD